jgi:hypothetical protein
VIGEALVEVWGGGQRLGRAGEQAEEQGHHGDANGDGGGRCVLGHAQGRDPGVYRPGASQAASPERRAYRNHGMGGKVVGDVQRGSGQWRMAVRPRACALRPHVAGLGVGGVSRP